MNNLLHSNKSGNVIWCVDLGRRRIIKINISSERVCRKLFSKSVFSSARVNCWNSAVKLPSICSLLSRNILTHTATRNRLHTSRSHFSLSVSLKQPNMLHQLKTLSYLYYNIQRDATMSSQYFISLQYYSTCFGRSSHPSSGVQETVVTSTGIVIYPGELGGVKGKNH
jgi:hypothetical protein